MFAVDENIFHDKKAKTADDNQQHSHNLNKRIADIACEAGIIAKYVKPRIAKCGNGMKNADGDA